MTPEIKKIFWVWIGAVIVFSAGVYLFQKNHVGQGNQITCTMEAKICPDGSYVSRTGPNCEFSKCPGSPSTELGAIGDIANWKTYRNEKYGFEFRYPEELIPDTNVIQPGGLVYFRANKFIDLTFLLIENRESLDLEKWLRVSNFDENYLRKETTFVDGIKAYQFDYQNNEKRSMVFGQKFRSVFFKRGMLIFQFEMRDRPDSLNNLLSTFKFLK